MERIKKILIFLIIIVLLQSVAIVTLHQKWQMNMDSINDLANREVVTSNLIYSLQKQISQK